MSQHKKPFYWGASTASHQVEGGTLNQWSVWELSVAAEQAKTAEQRLGYLPDWEKIKSKATAPSNYISGKGVDHYNRYKEDFTIAKSLNLNAFRFSIEWSRLQPKEGEWDLAEIQHYREYIAELRAQGLEPFLNLWHWTSPTWFEDKGGFEKISNLKYFDAYVQKVVQELCQDIKYIVVINEPNVFVGFSYVLGEWPPQEKNAVKAWWVYHNLWRAHKRAYRIIKRQNKSIKVGVAYQLANDLASRPRHWADKLVAKSVDIGWDWWWLDRIKLQQDFIGFNFYFTDIYKGAGKDNPSSPQNDLGWYMDPSGILSVLRKVHKRYPRKPIFITENGVADADDQYRKWWLQETMEAIEQAQRERIPIHGYFHWSLLDNFEWAFGWWPKFGLVAVDREHGMKRTVRPSALWWAKEVAKKREQEKKHG